MRSRVRVAGAAAVAWRALAREVTPAPATIKAAIRYLLVGASPADGHMAPAYHPMDGSATLRPTRNPGVSALRRAAREYRRGPLRALARPPAGGRPPRFAGDHQPTRRPASPRGRR